MSTAARSMVKRLPLSAQYVRPVPKSFTEACEAPAAMWEGAIPLRRFRSAEGATTVKKLYEHPAEKRPQDLGANAVNGVYCMSNDDLIRTFPEGLGGKVMQAMPPGHPRGFLYRKESHLLNLLVDKLPHWESKQSVIRSLTGGRPGIIVDGATGTGKSALMCQVVHYARSRNILTMYIPNARTWTHGEWCWPSTILPGFFDAPDAARAMLEYFSKVNKHALSQWSLKKTPRDLPVDAGEKAPTTLYELCQWGFLAAAPASIDRQSVAVKYLMDELMEEKRTPILFVVDGMNLFSQNTHFRYPHPDFLRTLASYRDGSTDVDLYPQELPRIPASRLSLVRGLNLMMLEGERHPNKLFISATTRDFKPFDGGVTGFEDVETDKHRSRLDEYAPFDAERDTVLHPLQLKNFDDYEYRSYLRFLINSGELAGLGWGPLWHYSSPFERKLYKIEFMSDRNPQRVVDHYHQELVWKYEYHRLRQKQYLTNRRSQLLVRRREQVAALAAQQN